MESGDAQFPCQCLKSQGACHFARAPALDKAWPFHFAAKRIRSHGNCHLPYLVEQKYGVLGLKFQPSYVKRTPPEQGLSPRVSPIVIRRRPLLPSQLHG